MPLQLNESISVEEALPAKFTGAVFNGFGLDKNVRKCRVFLGINGCDLFAGCLESQPSVTPER